MQTAEMQASAPIADLITAALHSRPELAGSDIDLVTRQISRRAARNALLPALSLVGFYGGSGLGGPLNPAYSLGQNVSTVPVDFAGALQNAFNNTAPDYYVGLNLNLPIRNRVAKADQYRSELEYRQSELRMEQLKKQVRIEVRNAQYALDQTGARLVLQTICEARGMANTTLGPVVRHLRQLAGPPAGREDPADGAVRGACERAPPPPAGRARWTVRLVAEQARGQGALLRQAAAGDGSPAGTRGWLLRPTTGVENRACVREGRRQVAGWFSPA